MGWDHWRQLHYLLFSLASNMSPLTKLEHCIYFCAGCRPLLALQATLERVGRRGNTGDLDTQPFYKFIKQTYGWHVVAMFGALYLLGGFPAVVWGGALRVAWVYHITWFVNSASHCWGSQSYNTGDLSRNNWSVPLAPNFLASHA